MQAKKSMKLLFAVHTGKWVIRKEEKKRKAKVTTGGQRGGLEGGSPGQHSKSTPSLQQKKHPPLENPKITPSPIFHEFDSARAKMAGCDPEKLACGGPFFFLKNFPAAGLFFGLNFFLQRTISLSQVPSSIN